MNFAFCIGNGSSKNKFDLNSLKDVGPTYGCNALIETFDLDNTIIVDKDLLIDIISRGFNKKTNINFITIVQKKQRLTGIRASNKKRFLPIDRRHFLRITINHKSHRNLKKPREYDI